MIRDEIAPETSTLTRCSAKDDFRLEEEVVVVEAENGFENPAASHDEADGTWEAPCSLRVVDGLATFLTSGRENRR